MSARDSAWVVLLKTDEGVRTLGINQVYRIFIEDGGDNYIVFSNQILPDVKKLSDLRQLNQSLDYNSVSVLPIKDVMACVPGSNFGGFE